MKKWSFHGWEHLSGFNPEVTKERCDILQRLDRVAEPERTKWYGRLKSKLDHLHFATRLEIQLHDFFLGSGWDVEIEPTLPGTRNQPDFFLKRGVEELLVEAKTVFDPDSISEQETRLHELAENLTRRLQRTISIHPGKELPPVSLPNKKIAAAIEHKASNAKEELLEFHVTGEHLGYAYDLVVTVLIDEKPSESAGVGSTMSLFNPVETGQRMRKEIIEKAGKYGDLGIPFIVAVWPKTTLYNSSLTDEFNDDSIALDGDEVWVTSWSKTWARQEPNGVFTIRKRDGTPRYSRVSAVIIYNFTYNDGPCHSFRVYHNPFAKFPVGSHVFRDFQQARFSRITDSWVWESYVQPQGRGALVTHPSGAVH